MARFHLSGSLFRCMAFIVGRPDGNTPPPTPPRSLPRRPPLRLCIFVMNVMVVVVVVGGGGGGGGSGGGGGAAVVLFVVGAMVEVGVLWGISVGHYMYC